MDKFSVRLKQAMLIKNLRQSDIVNRCQLLSEGTVVSRQDISLYLSNKTKNPSSEKIMVIAKALEVNPEWLAGFNVDMNATSSNDKIVQTTNNSVNTNNSVVINGDKNPNLSEEEEELLRGYNALTHRQRHDIMSLIYKYEDENQK